MDDMPVSTGRRPAGRPRRLSLDAVVDAACAIGIERLDMAVLADHLNTGVATLYGYVRGRDHLRQLVAQRTALHALDRVEANEWQGLLRAHAEICFSNFKSGPELIATLMEGPRGEEEIAYTRLVTDRLMAHGLDHQRATEAFIGTTQIVLGAAVMRLRPRAPAQGTEEAMVLQSDEGADYRITLERYIRDMENNA